MKSALAILLICGFGIAGYCQAEEGPVPFGSGEYTFADRGIDKEMTVYYYKPRKCTADSGVIICLSGEIRNASSIRAEWIEHAERLNSIVLAPEFAPTESPLSAYCLGNIAPLPAAKGEKAKINAPERWVYTVVENLFLAFKEKEGTKSDTYIALAFAVNAGAYFFADRDRPWPIGTAGVDGLAERVHLEGAFSFPLVLVLGEADTMRRYDNTYLDPDLLLSLGNSNFERGRNAYARYEKIAQENGQAFTWVALSVPAAGHFDRKLSKTVADYIEKRYKR